MRDILYIVVIFLGNLVKITGSCTLPDELTGTWHSAQKGPLTFNSTHIVGYPVFMSVSVQSLDFECIGTSDRKYAFKSTETAFIFGGNFNAYMCVEFWRVSATKYYYLHNTPISTTNNDHTRGSIEGTTPAISAICSISSDTSSFVTILKDGSVDDGSSEATCPSDLLNAFSAVTISQYNAASSCANNVMDGCSSKTKISFTYDPSCTAVHKFSEGGNWNCLRSIVSNGYTYVSLWNNDTTISSSFLHPYNFVSGQTYRFACLVVSGTSATLFPKICSDSTQTPTSVSSPGLKLTFSGASSSCSLTTEPESDLVYYIIMILGALFIISLVILLIILYKKGVFRKCKRKCFNSNKVGPVEIIMSKPPLKVQPLYLDEPPRREKTDAISVLEFNTNFNFTYKQ